MSTINIHEYPSDESLVPAYRIAVMQAALEGKEVECYNLTRLNPLWTRIISEPIWDWSNNHYRITPPAIAPGHNPAKLTVDQIGEGYRTLSVEENDALESARGVTDGLEFWLDGQWRYGGTGGTDTFTYRTACPEGYFLPKPVIADGFNPAGLTVEQIGAGYRTLSEEEATYLQGLRGDTPVSGLEYFSDYRKVWNQEAVGDSRVMTYRTTNPPGHYLPKKTRYFIHKNGPFRSCREGEPFYSVTVVPEGGEDKVFFDYTDGHRHRAIAYTLKEIECYVKDGSWVEFDGDIKPFLPKPAPVIAQGHNPANITVDKIPAGWRLFSKEEYEYLHKTKSFTALYPSVGHTRFWYGGKWSQIGLWGLYNGTDGGTLITDKPTGFYLPKQPETVMEWLLTLPKEYRVLAIRNMSETTKDVRRLDLPSAIGSAFVWSGSPEGHEFWESVRNSLKQGIPLPPIPVVSAPKKLVPWTLETMVWPDCVRNKDNHARVYGVGLAQSDGLHLGVRPEGRAIYITTWQRLYDECEYSIDNGQTWLPCGSLEEEKKS